MKIKIILFCALFVMASLARAQYVSIPDAAFGSWLSSHGCAACMTDSSASGWLLDTTCQAVLADTSMTLPGYTDIVDLDGIQYFRNLQYLWCANDPITTIPALPPALVTFVCDNDTGLRTLPPLPATLQVLQASACAYSTLPALPSSLAYLDCSLGSLGTLPALPDSLTYLDCSGSVLYLLPILPPALSYLDCHSNRLLYLPSVLPDSLAYFNCSFNSDINCMPHLGIVTFLNFLGTAITCLPDSPAGLMNCYPSFSVCDSACVPIYYAIGSVSAPAKVAIYPDPASDHLTVTYTSDGSGAAISIADMLRRSLYTGSLGASGPQLDIDVSTWPPGMYTYSLQSGDGRTSAGTFIVGR